MNFIDIANRARAVCALEGIECRLEDVGGINWHIDVATMHIESVVRLIVMRSLCCASKIAPKDLKYFIENNKTLVEYLEAMRYISNVTEGATHE